MLYFRTAIVNRRLESGENPRDLPGSPASLRRQQAAAEAWHSVCETALRTHRAPHARQPELGDVLLVQTKEQETATIPSGNMGRRHENVVAI